MRYRFDMISSGFVWSRSRSGGPRLLGRPRYLWSHSFHARRVSDRWFRCLYLSLRMSCRSGLYSVAIAVSDLRVGMMRRFQVTKSDPTALISGSSRTITVSLCMDGDQPEVISRLLPPGTQRTIILIINAFLYSKHSQERIWSLCP